MAIAAAAVVVVVVGAVLLWAKSTSSSSSSSVATPSIVEVVENVLLNQVCLEVVSVSCASSQRIVFKKYRNQKSEQPALSNCSSPLS